MTKRAMLFQTARWICLFMMFAVSSGVDAYPPDYGPFRSGHEPKPFKLRTWPEISRTETASGMLRLFDLTDIGRLEILISPDEGDFMASLRDGSGTMLLPTTKVTGSQMCDIRVLSARLNSDAKPDVVIETWGGGCGLAGEIGYRTFLLSEGSRFVAVPVMFFSLSDADFIDIDGNGRPEMIHTAFIDGEEGGDGRSHNYWVHNLLAFRKTGLVSANARHPAFPSWIQYKHRANHRRTEQLTPAQRVRLWRTSSYTWFETFARLAEEQGRN